MVRRRVMPRRKRRKMVMPRRERLAKGNCNMEGYAKRRGGQYGSKEVMPRREKVPKRKEAMP